MLLHYYYLSGTLPPIQIHNKPIVGSMDVKALYPSILKEMAGDAAIKAINKSKLEWEGIDVSTLTRYVALKIDSDKVSKAGLDRVVPLPNGTTTLKSFISPRGKVAKRTNGESQFYPARNQPTAQQVVKLIGLVVQDCIEVCMDSHF